MNKSVSQRELAPREMAKSPSKRAIYQNEQTSRKEVSTIFHSPYKDGRRNPNYFNPSFVSSHLLYPKQHLQTQQKQIVVTKNYIPNPNDIKKDALYRQRMHTENTPRSKTNERMKKNNKDCNKQPQTKIARIFRANQPQTLLSNQLGILHNYRQNYREKQQPFIQLSRKVQPQTPAYLQNLNRTQRSIYKKEEEPKSVELSKYNAVKKELNDLKRQLKRTNAEVQNRNMDKIIMQTRQLQRQEYFQQKKQSELLGNILREQIKTNELIKNKRWNY